MKFFRYFISKFYQRDRAQSATQLEKDFLEFPPFPLVSTGLKNEFDVVSLYGPGRSLYFFKLFYRCFFNEDYNFNKNLDSSSELLNTRKVLKKSKIDCINSFVYMKKEFKSNCFLKRILMIAVFFVLSPALMLVLLVLVAYLAIRFALIVFKLKRITFGSYGIFLPLVKGRETIAIRPSLAKKNGINISAIVSHEHIHLLQYLNADFHNKHTVVRPEFFIKKDMLDPYIIYLFEIDEVEARLHEVVLSYYRKFKELPLDLYGFVDIILASHEINSLLKKLVGEKVFNAPKSKKDMFYIREKDAAKDIRHMLVSLKNEDHRYKFVTEVMATMYGNLLKLYGDEKASKKFMSQIECPNFYDRFYGRSVSNCEL